MKSSLSNLLIRSGTVAAWGAFGWISVFAIVMGARHARPVWFQIDWRVYVAGAQDLLDRSLYRESLHLDGLPLPVSEFSLPPASALWAVPLIGLPLEVGGVVWQLAMAASLGVAAVLVARVIGAPRPLLIAALALLPMALHVSYLEGIIGGTNNHLVLAMVALFAWAHVERRERTAGIALALAIGTKLWPIALVVLLLRERRWSSLGWTAAVLGVQAAATTVWLGPDIGGHIAAAFRDRIPIESAVLGFTALGQAFEWWPAWVAPAVALVLVALPVRGRAAVGVGMLAGLAIIPNLWLHYLPTVVAACALIASDAWVASATTRGRLWKRPDARRQASAA